MADIVPMDAFKSIFSILLAAGLRNPKPDFRSPIARNLHRILRIVIYLILIIHDIQHIVYVYQIFGDTAQMLKTFCAVCSSTNFTMKYTALYFNSEKFNKFEELLDDQMFKPTCEKDRLFLRRNKRYLHRLCTAVCYALPMCTLSWFAALLLDKKLNSERVVPTYYPFSTVSWQGYFWGLLIELIVLSWTAYGYMMIDCLIAGYYIQARAQLCIIKHHLEHLACDHMYNDGVISTMYRPDGTFVYKDDQSDRYLKKLIQLVVRYSKVIGLVQELESAVNAAMLYQFLCSVAIFSAIVFRLTKIPVNLEFAHLVLYLGCLLLGLMLYCYNGTYLENESGSVNESVYLGDWLSFSPRFRKLLLIAMVRWTRPFTARAAGLVTLSLNTFIIVIRASYTMYTIVK